MALAQIGLFTSVAETLATAVGAGMLLGAFGAGAVGVVGSWRRPALEARAVIAGYIGGIGVTFLALVDLVIRYIS